MRERNGKESHVQMFKSPDNSTWLYDYKLVVLRLKLLLIDNIAQYPLTAFNYLEQPTFADMRH